jgi:ATP-dependent DNA helicase DinG
MIAPVSAFAESFPERVREIFSPEGLLAKAKNFEYRSEQQAMAVAVATALSEERHLVVEAGTGVGQIARLTRAVGALGAGEKEEGGRLHLHDQSQEQLVYKDIPIVQKVLPEEFEVMLWKGRQNYLCPAGSSAPWPQRANSSRRPSRLS